MVLLLHPPVLQFQLHRLLTELFDLRLCYSQVRVKILDDAFLRKDEVVLKGSELALCHSWNIKLPLGDEG
jgi:hypothetical protein